MASPTIHVEAIVSGTTGDPEIVLDCEGTLYVLTPKEARALGFQLVQTVEEGYIDAAMVKWITETLRVNFPKALEFLGQMKSYRRGFAERGL
jgi:hypothetical protein